jgi:ElaB/YqjD/DUF883 family membrane-anchored ribosome-binding protein
VGVAEFVSNAEGFAVELYYRDLISEEASLEKLVDDLMLVVQGTDAQAGGANLQGLPREEILSRLVRLKQACRKLQGQASAKALRLDKLLRQYPYPVVAFAFALGLVAGRFVMSRVERHAGDLCE